MNAQTFDHPPRSTERRLLTASLARRICRANAPFHPMDMDRNAGRLLALSALGAALCAAAARRVDSGMCQHQQLRGVALGFADGQNRVKEGW
jgi:hypothetical protein